MSKVSPSQLNTKYIYLRQINCIAYNTIQFIYNLLYLQKIKK